MLYLQKIISHGPKFSEPQHNNWNHNLKLVVNSVEEYGRTKAKG